MRLRLPPSACTNPRDSVLMPPHGATAHPLPETPNCVLNVHRRQHGSRAACTASVHKSHINQRIRPHHRHVFCNAACQHRRPQHSSHHKEIILRLACDPTQEPRTGARAPCTSAPGLPTSTPGPDTAPVEGAAARLECGRSFGPRVTTQSHRSGLMSPHPLGLPHHRSTGHNIKSSQT